MAVLDQNTEIEVRSAGYYLGRALVCCPKTCSDFAAVAMALDAGIVPEFDPPFTQKAEG